MIAFGSSDMTKAYIGSTEVSKAYLGSDLAWGGSSPALPYDAEIAYLTATGTQWINTDIVPQEGDYLQIYFKQTSAKDHAAFGLAGVIYCFSNGNKSSSGTYWAYPPSSGGATGNANNPLRDTAWHTVKMSTDGVYVDNALLGNITGTTGTPNNTIGLFGRKANQASTSMAKLFSGSIGYFKYKRNDVLIADYIPVRVGTVGYMYDKVSNTLLGNAGTGSFTLGTDV